MQLSKEVEATESNVYKLEDKLYSLKNETVIKKVKSTIKDQFGKIKVIKEQILSFNTDFIKFKDISELKEFIKEEILLIEAEKSSAIACISTEKFKECQLFVTSTDDMFFKALFQLEILKLKSFDLTDKVLKDEATKLTENLESNINDLKNEITKLKSDIADMIDLIDSITKEIDYIEEEKNNAEKKIMFKKYRGAKLHLDLTTDFMNKALFHLSILQIKENNFNNALLTARANDYSLIFNDKIKYLDEEVKNMRYGLNYLMEIEAFSSDIIHEMNFIDETRVNIIDFIGKAKINELNIYRGELRKIYVKIQNLMDSAINLKNKIRDELLKIDAIGFIDKIRLNFLRVTDVVNETEFLLKEEIEYDRILVSDLKNQKLNAEKIKEFCYENPLTSNLNLSYGNNDVKMFNNMKCVLNVENLSDIQKQSLYDNQIFEQEHERKINDNVIIILISGILSFAFLIFAFYQCIKFLKRIRRTHLKN